MKEKAMGRGYWITGAFVVLTMIAGAANGRAAADRYHLPAYDLPADCPAFAADHDRIWKKLYFREDVNGFIYYEAICEQYFLARKSPETAAHDYVSKLDFATLTLDEIPYIDCEVGVLSRSYEAWCKDLNRNFPTLSQAHFLILWELFPKPADFPEATPEHIAAARAVPIDRESCRLARNNNFGRHTVYTDRNLVLRDGRAVCVEVPYNDIYPGFDFDTSQTLFRDVDGDGYMDALLLIGNYGGGGHMFMTTLVVVTKKQPGPGPLIKVRFQRRWSRGQ